jgi:hypothetical protein
MPGGALSRQLHAPSVHRPGLGIYDRSLLQGLKADMPVLVTNSQPGSSTTSNSQQSPRTQQQRASPHHTKHPLPTRQQPGEAAYRHQHARARRAHATAQRAPSTDVQAHPGSALSTQDSGASARTHALTRAAASFALGGAHHAAVGPAHRLLLVGGQLLLGVCWVCGVVVVCVVVCARQGGGGGTGHRCQGDRRHTQGWVAWWVEGPQAPQAAAMHAVRVQARRRG